MTSCRRRGAFTLIEVLIVVIIMAVLAATIIPQFSSSTKDAKESSLKFNLHTMRAQVQRYKFDHNGSAPTAANFEKQMTLTSDATGATVTTPDATHPFGPYVASLPANSFSGKKGVTTCTGKPAAEVAGDFGWQYDEATGQVYPNTTGYFDL